MNYLIIVESPSKCKKIQGYLQNRYVNIKFTVIASVGHIYNLPKNYLGIDLKKFEGKFLPLAEKKGVIKKITACKGKYDKILIGTDRDNEGEAIGFDIMTLLGMDFAEKNRMVFNEITEDGICSAFENLTYLNIDMVNAQRARRLVDRLIGFKLSGITKKAFNNKNVTAGRVISIATKIVHENNLEYKNYKNSVSNEIIGEFKIEGDIYTCKYSKTFETEKDSQKHLNTFISKQFDVKFIESNMKKQYPPPPYTTASMNIDSPYPVKKTSEILQKLYQRGFITYIRTDSYNMSKSAKLMFVNYCPIKEDIDYSKVNSNSASSTHECIRPTNPLKYTYNTKSLKDDFLVIYNMIFKRSMLYLLKPHEYEEFTYKIQTEGDEDYFDLRLKQTRVLGFKKYLKIINDQKNNVADISDLEKINNSRINYEKIFTNKTTTHFNLLNEGGLIRSLKCRNIGRPSTYSHIIENMKDKKYIEIKDVEKITEKYYQSTLISDQIKTSKMFLEIPKQSKKLLITETGIKITEFLNNNFKNIMDYEYSSNLEKYLDDIEEKKITHVEVIKTLYDDFKDLIVTLDKQFKKEKKIKEINLGSYKDFSNIYIKHTRYGWKVVSHYKDTVFYNDFNTELISDIENIKIKNIEESIPVIKMFNGEPIVILTGHDGGKYIKYGSKNIPITKKIRYCNKEFFEQMELSEVVCLMNK